MKITEHLAFARNQIRIQCHMTSSEGRPCDSCTETINQLYKLSGVIKKITSDHHGVPDFSEEIAAIYRLEEIR